MEVTDKQTEGRNLLIALALAAVCLLVLGMYAGGYLMCEAGGGEITGFACIDIDVIGVCDLGGERYPIQQGNITIPVIPYG